MTNVLFRMKNIIYLLCAVVLGVGIGVVLTQKMIRPSVVGGSPIGAFEQQFPGFFAGPMVNAKLSALPEGTLVKLGSQVITMADVQKIMDSENPQMRQRMLAELPSLIEQLAQDMLIKQELRDWALAAGISEKTPLKSIGEAYQADLIKKTDVSDADIETFYKQQSSQYGGKMPPLDVLHDQIKQSLVRSATVKKLTESINRQASKCEVSRPWVDDQYKKLLLQPDVVAVEKLRYSGKPVVLVFAMSEPKMMSAVNQQMSELKRLVGDKARGAVVPISKPTFLTARYRVRSFWVTIVFNAEGREVYRTEGQVPTEELQLILKQAGM